VELRLRHKRALELLPFDGIALGGFSVGEPNESMHATLREVAPTLDPGRPHYLMGVGTPADLIRAIGCGVDVFDCVMPTRNARNGQAFIKDGKIVIKHAKYRHDLSPLDPECPCSTCSGGLSRSYLRHLFIARELSVFRYLSVHNLTYYAALVASARKAIVEGRFADFAHETLTRLG
jgi:queuine tRNA-ribosyltransferase